MAYMVHQRFTTAVREAYGGEGREGDLRRNLDAAKATVAWLDTLEIDDSLRAALIEPIAVVEEAFRGLVTTSRSEPRGDG